MTKTIDLSHLDSIRNRLAHERERLGKAKTEQERQLLTVWVAQIERELAAELRFLGIDDAPLPEISDDELLAALSEQMRAANESDSPPKPRRSRDFRSYLGPAPGEQPASKP